MPIEEYTPRWQEAVTALAAEIFGPGYFGKASEIASVENSRMLVDVTRDGGLNGYVLGRLLGKGELNDFLENRVTNVPAELAEADAAGTLGVIQTVAVAPHCLADEACTDCTIAAGVVAHTPDWHEHAQQGKDPVAEQTAVQRHPDHCRARLKTRRDHHVGAGVNLLDQRRDVRWVVRVVSVHRDDDVVVATMLRDPA